MFLPKLRHDDPLLGKQYVLHISILQHSIMKQHYVLFNYLCVFFQQKNVLYPTAG